MITLSILIVLALICALVGVLMGLFSLIGLLASLLVGVLVGALAGHIANRFMGTQTSTGRNIVLGILGSFVGEFLFGLIGIHAAHCVAWRNQRLSLVGRRFDGHGLGHLFGGFDLHAFRSIHLNVGTVARRTQREGNQVLRGLDGNGFGFFGHIVSLIVDGQSHFLDVSGRGIRTFGCLVDGLLGSLRLFLGRHLFLAPFHRGVPIGLAAGDRLANLPLGNDIGLQLLVGDLAGLGQLLRAQSGTFRLLRLRTFAFGGGTLLHLGMVSGDLPLPRHGLLGRTHTQREHRGQQRGRNEREQRAEVQCERTDQHNDRDCQQ